MSITARIIERMVILLLLLLFLMGEGCYAAISHYTVMLQDKLELMSMKYLLTRFDMVVILSILQIKGYTKLGFQIYSTIIF